MVYPDHVGSIPLPVGDRLLADKQRIIDGVAISCEHSAALSVDNLRASILYNPVTAVNILGMLRWSV